MKALEQQPHPHRSVKDQPYILMGRHVHACCHKFARYFGAKVKWVPIKLGTLHVTAEQVRDIFDTLIVDDPQVMEECGYTPQEVAGRRIGELIMAVVCVAGTTYSADIDDIAGIDRVLTSGGWDTPIHVDAASGGCTLPFVAPDLLWDFRLPHVQSINVSNSKFGGVYAGLGTLVFRDSTIVPDDLLVDIEYLTGNRSHYGLNFSRPSLGVILQYYNFLRLGKQGYRDRIQTCLTHAQTIARTLQDCHYFDILSRTDLFPVVVCRLTESAPFKLAELAQFLKAQGWMVPVYHLPPNAQDIEVMRIVVRNDLRVSSFLHDVEAAIQTLTAHRQAVPGVA